MPSVIDVLPAGPPKPVGPTTKKATRPTNKLPRSLIEEAQSTRRETFNPEKHLNFQKPARIYTMEDIGLKGQGISPVAASEPFSLFTPEAIRQMRAEIFSDPCLAKCQYASTFAKNMIRGMGRERAPFTYAAWNCPELLKKISEVAGVELAVSLDWETANVNISVSEDPIGDLKSQSISPKPDDGAPAFAWHYDSYPFVCVTMLSDCTGMTGGETAIRTPTGEIHKIRGPAMGTAVMMQGRYIEHQALKAHGGRERISMVTSFRPKCPLAPDETVLTGSRPISQWSELYNQWTEYRLEVLEERIRAQLKVERSRELAKRPFDISSTLAFLKQQMAFLEATAEELIQVPNMDEE